MDNPFDQTSADADGFVESLVKSEGGKAVVDDGAKLFNEGKLGVGKPNPGNAPNGDNDGKPNGRPQGRSKNVERSIKVSKQGNQILLLKLEVSSSCCFLVIVSLLLLLMVVVVVIADQRE